MLVKNPEPYSLGFSDVKELVDDNRVTSLICDNPFTKTFLLTKMMDVMDESVFYVDFDLLYSGYVISELIPLPKNVSLVKPEIRNFNYKISELVAKISEEKCVLILDSLNGFYNFFGNVKSGRLLNSYIMLLASNTMTSKSMIVLTSISKYKNKEGWILQPTGRHLQENENIKKLYVQKINSVLSISRIENDKKSKTFEIDNR